METPKGERFSDLRLEQAVDVGAEVLVTSCPYCITNFEDSRLSREDGRRDRDQGYHRNYPGSDLSNSRPEPRKEDD